MADPRWDRNELSSHEVAPHELRPENVLFGEPLRL
jgi:hypothetical protein